jgi:hypothetical protein
MTKYLNDARFGGVELMRRNHYGPSVANLHWTRGRLQKDASHDPSKAEPEQRDDLTDVDPLELPDRYGILPETDSCHDQA